jgi:copper homeostasis protein
MIRTMVLVEACVETLTEARAAHMGGAGRVELCANLAEGGMTPDEGLLSACVESLAIPVFAMIRPRTGPFVYTPSESALIEHQVGRARELGARGIVAGCVTAAGSIDAATMRLVVEAASPLPVTFHRAFDRVADRTEALETLISLGVARALTSGGASTATEGAGEIARLVRQAAGRIVIVAGGNVRADNVRDLVARTGVTEVHGHLTTAGTVGAVVEATRTGTAPAS